MKGKIRALFTSLLLALCLIPFGITAFAAEETPETQKDGTVKITFDYGINADLISNNYKSGDVTYSTSTAVIAGEAVDLNEAATLPSYGDEIEMMYFDHWTGDDGKDYSSGYSYPFEKDTTLTAHWYHKITYLSTDEGHFYDGSTSYSSGFISEEFPFPDVSVCCYTNKSNRAFVGWKLPDGTALTPELASQSAVYQNLTLTAVYTDGYPVTFDVNSENGSIKNYSESYKCADGYPVYTENRSVDETTKKLTFTYPKGVMPSEAPYFCYDPIKYPETYLTGGDESVIFKNWSDKATGGESVYFSNLTPAGDGTDTIYAQWESFWTVSFDSNESEEDDPYPHTVQVVKGSAVGSIPTNYFRTEGVKRCDSFNTKKDGTGETITYEYVPTGNIRVYAQYVPIWTVSLRDDSDWENDKPATYTINDYYTDFDIDRGEKCEDDFMHVSVTWNKDASGKKSNKILNHWNTKLDDTGTKPPFTPTANTTLYAIPEEGVLVTFNSDAREDDPNNKFGSLISFEGEQGTQLTFAYSKKIPMNENIQYAYYKVPAPSYHTNDDTKKFAGWSEEYGNAAKIIDPDKFIPTKDLTLYAIWDDLVNVTYHGNGGTFPGYYGEQAKETYVTQEIKGKKFSLQESNLPEMTGKVFIGWTDSENSTKPVAFGTKVLADKALDFYALWEDGYTITLDANGGSLQYMSSREHEHYGEETNVVFTIRKGATVLDKSFSEDYGEEQVRGWAEKKVLGGFSKTKGGEKIDLTDYVPEGDETFYAVWEDPVSVTYDPGEGKLEDYEENPVYLAKGKTLKSIYYQTPTPTLAGKEFVGWFTASDGRFNDLTPVTADIKVTAKYTTETSKVTFNAGENATVNSRDAEGKAAQTLEIAVPKGSEIDLKEFVTENSSEDLKFTGWKAGEYFWSADNKNGYYEVADDEVTFTAQWVKPVYYNLTFKGNGGLVDAADMEDDPSEELELGIEQGSVVGDTIFATKEGQADQIFTGWYSDEACTAVNLVATAETIAAYKPTSDMILYAGWETKKVAVTSVSLDKEILTLGVKDGVADTYQLKVVILPLDATNNKVTFTSSAPDIATVSESGLITAVKAGTAEQPAQATITVKTEDGGFTASCVVTVTDQTTSEVKNSIDALIDSIDNAADAAAAKTALESELEKMGGADVLAGMAVQDEDVAKKLAELEESYKAATGVTVTDLMQNDAAKKAVKDILGVDANADNLKVEGAGLNADPNQTIGLSVSAVPEDKQQDIDETKYTNAKQIDMSLTVVDGQGEKKIEALRAPVTVTLPIPSQMVRQKLVILHFDSSGNITETIRPVFKNNSMSVTVSHFSIFAIVELAEPQGGSDITPTPTPTQPPADTPAGTPTPTPPAGGQDPAITTVPTPTQTPVAAPAKVRVTR